MKTTATAPEMGASAASTSRRNAGSEPLKLLERIGSTTIEVSIHFSSKSKETMEDKILRLIERGGDKSA